jgi:type IV secretion system protein VirD4
MTSGLDQWQNPAIDEATAVSDFDFRTIRKKPFSVYLVVQPLMVKPLAPLIRLLFSDLLSALQDKEPGPDEPWPVMIMLDEFNRLGKMPIVAESIEVLRHYRGHLAVVTQTIPAIDEIYGENTRRALQGNAGVKLYLTPSDEKTVEELSKAVGKTTKTVVTKSRSIGKNPFEGRSQSTRTEETSLLPEDEARRLPLDEIVVVVDAQMPVRAKRIQYFGDPFFKKIHAAQVGEMPFPGGPEGPPHAGGPTNEGLVEPSSSGARSLSDAVDAGIQSRPSVSANRTADRQSVKPVSRAAVISDDQRQIEMDFVEQSSLEIESPTDKDVAQVELALGDLDQLEGEVSGLKDAEGNVGEKASVG